MRIVALSTLAHCLFFMSSAMALECKGHMVNGYGSTDYGFKKFQSMMVTFEDCGRFTPNVFAITSILMVKRKLRIGPKGNLCSLNQVGHSPKKLAI